MSERLTNVVYFPAQAVDTIECAYSGEPIPAVIVARMGTKGWIYCQHCSARKKESTMHTVDLKS